ncbi:hypothetical protein [Sorangium sp. So ce861]|uniref:hypothetical protein n=1 Tax=Sorangium sp. So ce861 TaxID=3133323 RepID=UPI003F5E5F3F
MDEETVPQGVRAQYKTVQGVSTSRPTTVHRGSFGTVSQVPQERALAQEGCHMTLDDEITEVEGLAQVARSAATESLERATNDLRLGREALDRYQRLVDAAITSAESTLRHCRKIASDPTDPARAPTTIVQGMLAATRESIGLMHAAVAIIDELAGAGGQLDVARGAATPRSCSFCGDTGSKVVAGPEANICASCTRLACGVLGIELSASDTE